MADTILQTYRSARVEYTTLHGITETELQPAVI
jgi:hypothetical protein